MGWSLRRKLGGREGEPACAAEGDGAVGAAPAVVVTTADCAVDLRLTAELTRAMGGPDGGLQVAAQRRGRGILIRVAGNVDASNVSRWRHLLGAAAGQVEAPGRLTVDTGGLEFIAVCAFAVLGEEAARRRRQGIVFCLVSDQSVVGRVVAAVGLDSMLELSSTVEAVTARSPRDAPGPDGGRK
ncbi:anti-sigma factor antagonist [Mycolicibacter minnesotensis]